MMQKPEQKLSKQDQMLQVEAEALIIQQFRLFVCMMRASIRKQSMHIGKAAKSVTAVLADDVQCPLVQSVICLVAETLEAILSLRRVRQLHLSGLHCLKEPCSAAMHANPSMGFATAHCIWSHCLHCFGCSELTFIQPGYPVRAGSAQQIAPPNGFLILTLHFVMSSF